MFAASGGLILESKFIKLSKQTHMHKNQEQKYLAL